jgi:hypothetical protein
MSTSLRTRRADDPEQTAYHEAGHAIMYLGEAGNLRSVTIVPSRRGIGIAMGKTFSPDQLHAWWLQAPDERSRAVVELLIGRRVRCNLAGWIAEFMHAGERLRHWPNDGGDITGPTGALAHICLTAPDHVLRSNERLGAYYATQVAIEARRTRRYLRRHWPHVRTIAEALLKRGTLRGRELRALTSTMRLAPVRIHDPRLARETIRQNTTRAELRARRGRP